MSANVTPSRDGFGDDRLLAFVLDLDEDTELVAALATSSALRQRLARVRDDVSTVCDRLQAAVSHADPGYADPTAARWQRLRSSFVAETRSATHSGRRRVGRLAPIAAAIAIFAVAVGVAVRQLPGGTRTESVAEKGAAAPAVVADKTGTLMSDGGNGGATLLPQAEGFATVCVARASQLDDDGQLFRVVRVLKGQADRHLIISLAGGAVPLAVGSLQVLYLHPLLTRAWQGRDCVSLAADETQPTPQPAGVITYGATAMPPVVGGYGFGDEAALVQAVPDGVDISALMAP